MSARLLAASGLSVAVVAVLVYVAGDDHAAGTLALVALIIELVAAAEWLSRTGGGAP